MRKGNGHFQFCNNTDTIHNLPPKDKTGLDREGEKAAIISSCTQTYNTMYLITTHHLKLRMDQAENEETQ